MKTKCLIVTATKYFYQDIKPERVKYAMLSLMSHIIDIADVEVIDFEMMFGFPQSYEKIEEFKLLVKSVLKEKQPDIVAISCYTSFDYLATIDVLRICRELYPYATLVVGGYHPTALPDDFISEENLVDHIIRGEGEEALREIVLSGGKNLPKVIVGKTLELFNEKPLRYDLYPYQTDELYISLSRGCFHKCAFCVQSDDYNNPYRKMEVELIREKIDRAVKYFPIKRILFSDPIFGIDQAKTESLVSFLSENYPMYSYWAETRIDRLTEEMVACLSKLNMDLHFGVESLAEDTLINLMHKTKNAEYYKECFFKAVELCQKYNTLGLFGFIMNYPGEQAESSRFTFEQLKRVTELYDDLNVTFHMNQYTLYAGNKLYDMRYDLQNTRGFYFPNDGWWRVCEPNARWRSQNCLASDSIRTAYGDNFFYWHRDKNDLLRIYTGKFNFKAYSFYQRDEINSIIDRYNGGIIEEQSQKKVYEAVTRYRQMLSKTLIAYNEIIEKTKSCKFVDAFNRLYIYETTSGNNKVIDVCVNDAKAETMDSLFNEYQKMILEEYENNKNTLSVVGTDCIVKICNKYYWISENGEIKKRKQTDKVE